jgi:hypothetical protein
VEGVSPEQRLDGGVEEAEGLIGVHPKRWWRKGANWSWR